MPRRSSDWTVRPLEPGDASGVAELMDASVGQGFYEPDDTDQTSSFVCSCAGQIVGAVVVTIGPYATVRDFYREETPLTEWGVEPEPEMVGRVREIAALPDYRRTGLATLLLASSEAAVRAHGVEVFVANGWVRQDTGESPGGFLLASCGYRAVGEIPRFFELVGAAGGVFCPACHQSPCVCAARAYIKDCRLKPGATARSRSQS